MDGLVNLKLKLIEHLSIASVHLGGGLSKNADTVDAGEGGGL